MDIFNPYFVILFAFYINKLVESVRFRELRKIRKVNERAFYIFVKIEVSRFSKSSESVRHLQP